MHGCTPLQARICAALSIPVIDKRFGNVVKMILMAILLFGFSPSPAPAQDKPGTEWCAGFLNDLEHTVDAYGVRDTGSSPVPGQPLTRTTRFLEEMKYFITDQAEGEQWLNLLDQEGSLAVNKEIENLPDAALAPWLHGLKSGPGIGEPSSQDLRESLKADAHECAQALLSHAKKNVGWSTLALNSEEIPSEYRRARKVLGLYPLFTIPIGLGIANYKAKVSRQYAVPIEDLEPRGTLTLFSPGISQMPDLNGNTVEGLLLKASQNPLGIPLLSDQELKWIAERYAPVLEQDVTGDYDLPGIVVWQGPHMAVDTERPAVYYYATHAILRGSPLLQLNYVIWYKQRPRTGLLDIESGRIHGMTLRITLLPSGEPAMVDVIHNCGCYHFFFPSEKIFRGPKTELFREDAFVPQWLPPYEPGSRLSVRIGTRRHWVERIHYTGFSAGAPITYTLLPYDVLESLPRDSGRNESIFSPEGIVKGETERPERFLFFPAGIPDIGSMRQRGHHGTALIGERTFDDPRLFEEFFFLRK